MSELEELLHLDTEHNISDFGLGIHDAAIGEGVVVFTVHNAGCTYVQVLCPEIETSDVMQIDNRTTSQIRINVRTISKISYHVTSLVLGYVTAGPFAVVAGWDEQSIVLCFQPVHTTGQRTLRIPYLFGEKAISLEPIVSIAMASLPSGNFLLLCGTRNGRILTLEICGSAFEIIRLRCDRVGANFAYGLAVFTGNVEGAGAGPDAHVQFTLTGANGSASMVLDATLPQRLDQNSWTYVTLQTADLGDLQSVTVQFVPLGGSTNWYLDRINVASFCFGVSKAAVFQRWIDASGSFTQALA